MKKRYFLSVLLSVAAMMVLGGCGNRELEESPKVQKEREDAESQLITMNAVCLVYGRREPQRIFADRKTGDFFDATFPAGEIYGMKGEKITEEEIPNGAVVTITGDGMMLETYPGQYPGVKKMEITGQEEEAKVQEYLDAIYENIYSEPDPADRPMMQIQYRNSMAAASMAGLDPKSYDWTYEDYEGEKHHIEEDAGPVRDWSEWMDFEIPSEVDAPGYELHFYERPDKVQVTVYRQGQEKGEEIPVVVEAGAYYIEEIQAGTIYEVKATWEKNPYFNGWAIYGFCGTERKN